MATDQEYTNAANAVAAGNATPHQVELNNKMASQSGVMSELVRGAKNAQTEAAKRNN